MDSLFRKRAAHLALLVLLIGLLQPSSFPVSTARELRSLFEADEVPRQGVLSLLERTSLLYPEWDLPAEAAVRYALEADDPRLALEILEKHQPALTQGNPCLLIQLHLALDNAGTAWELWQTSPDTCRLQPHFLPPLTRFLISQQDYPAAADLQMLAVKATPQDPQAYFDLAKIFSLSEPERALAPLQMVRALTGKEDPLATGLIRAIEDTRPQNSPAFTFARIGIQYAAHSDWDFAILALARAVELEPDFAEALAYLGHALDQSGADGGASLEHALELDPDSATAWIFLAQHWLGFGETERASGALDRAHELDAENPVIFILEGTIHALQGDHDSAADAYLQACELEPEIPDFWLLLAEYSLKYEIRTGLGMEAARRALLLDPDNPRAMDLLGFAHYLHSSFVVASRLLERAASIDPNSPSAAFHLGLVYLETGQTEQAIKQLERTLIIDPEGHFSAIARRTLESMNR